VREFAYLRGVNRVRVQRMKVTLIVAALLVSGALAASSLAFAKRRNVWTLLELSGAICLGVVIFAHVAEEFHLFPGMGWGRADSSGHYVDLAAAVLGMTLLPLGICAGVFFRRRETKSRTN
jgi:hypothetical protein